MFKKTPIALAIISLMGMSATSHAENINISTDPGRYSITWNVGDAKDMNLSWGYAPITSENIKDGTHLSLAVPKNNKDASLVFFSNIDALSFMTSAPEDVSKRPAAIAGGPGELAFGLTITKPSRYYGELNEYTTVNALDSLTIHSERGHGIQVFLNDNKVAITDQEDLAELKKELGDKYDPNQTYYYEKEDSTVTIAAKNTTISTNNPDRWAIKLEGVDLPEGVEDEQNVNMVFLKHNSTEWVQLSDSYLDFWKEAGKEYGVQSIKDLQTLTVIGKNGAIDLNHRASLDVHAGAVDIQGRVRLRDGSAFMAGYDVAPVDKIPEYLRGYIGTEENSNVYRINSVNIQALDASAKDIKDRAAVSIQTGSHFAVAANTVSISGVQKNKNQYSEAIYLDTSASKYKAQDGTGEIGQYFFPAILSLYAKDSLIVNGDIIIDHEPTEEYATALVDIRSDGVLNINGKIRVVNTEGISGNTVQMTIKGNGQKFTGDIIDEINERLFDTQPALMTLSLDDEPSTYSSGIDFVQGTYIDISEGGQMDLTSHSRITQLTANQALIDAGTSTVSISNLAMSGDLTFYADTIQTGQFILDDVNVVQPMVYSLRQRSVPTTPSLSFVVDSVPNGVSAEQIAKIVTFGDANDNPGYTVLRNESSEATQLLVTVGAGADPTIDSELQENTSVAKSINDVAGLSVLAWRAQMNDVNKRLGDLRTYQGNHGGWARVYGSESEFGDLGLKSKSHTVQVGADTKLGDNFYFGATASYSDGKGKLNNGSTDDRSYSFGLYGGWMGNDGQFVDVIVKRANFKTDFDLRYTTGEQSTGSFDLWGTSLCAEYGWRLNVTDNVWVEPQAEVTYGYMNDVTYTYSGVKAMQEATESLVGRLGVALGTTFKSGSAYVKASVAHDWMGETEISMSNGNAAMKEDLGGTWGEFAVGGTYNFGNGWAVYGEFQTAHGSKMKTPWQYNLGARYVF